MLLQYNENYIKPIGRLYCGEVSARRHLVLFWLVIAGAFGPHSGEGLSTAERVKCGGAGIYEGMERLHKNSVYRISRSILA